MSSTSLPALLRRAASGAAASFPENRPPRPKRLNAKTILRAALGAVAAVWIAGVAGSVLLNHTALRPRVTERLAAAFGRPVKVGSFAISLWTGPVLQAYSVEMAEDPRFGYEYFLRADSLSVRLSLRALLRGHFVPGKLSLERPSLNAVRDQDGAWNIEEWLPRPQQPGSIPSRSSSGTLRVREMAVEGGRLNFKRGVEKLPFAFVNVSGDVKQDSAGRWQLRLDAVPFRAAMALQHPGTIHVSGYVGGTSSHLRPAVLDCDWSGIAIADLMRLFSGEDQGVRGSAQVSVRAMAQSEAWRVQAHATLLDVHRWDLPLLPGDPSLSISARTQWQPVSSGSRPALPLEALIEAPHSAIRISGDFFRRPALPQKAAPLRPATPPARDASAHVEVALDLRDVFAWVRAFHPSISSDLSLTGSARGDLSLSAVPRPAVDFASGGRWNALLDSARISLHSAVLSDAASHLAVRLSPVALRWNSPERGRPAKPGPLSWTPATISLARSDNGISRGLHPQSGILRIEPLGANPRDRTAGAGLRMAGTISEIRDVAALAADCGWKMPAGWDVSGVAALDARWTALPGFESGARSRAATPASRHRELIPTGSVALSGVSIRAPFLNLPIERVRATGALSPSGVRVALTSADAFETRWSGSASLAFGPKPASAKLPVTSGGWNFSLRAGRLSASALDRWLNRRWRETLLDRVVGFLSNARPVSRQIPDLHASGEIVVGEFSLGPLLARDLSGQVVLAGRDITLANATSKFYGGTALVSVEAHLGAATAATPAYDGDLRFSNVDLAALASRVPRLAGAFAGSAAGDMSVSAAGSDRDALAGSFACRGNVRASNFSWTGLRLPDSLLLSEPKPGPLAARRKPAQADPPDGSARLASRAQSRPAAASANGEMIAEGADPAEKHTAHFARISSAFTCSEGRLALEDLIAVPLHVAPGARLFPERRSPASSVPGAAETVLRGSGTVDLLRDAGIRIHLAASSGASEDRLAPASAKSVAARRSFLLTGTPLSPRLGALP